MRKLWQLFAGIIFIIIQFTRGYSSVSAPTLEIYLKVVNSENPTQTTDFVLSSQSTVWDGDLPPAYSDLTTWINEETTGGTCTVNNDGMGYLAGFNNSFSAIYYGHPIFGYGLYKLYSSNDLNGYIYLDYRDDNYCYYSQLGNPSGHGRDIWIDYDEESGLFFISNDGSVNSYIECTPNSTYSIWELNGMTRSTAKFPPHAPENLSGAFNSNEDYFVKWEHIIPADDYWTGYEIYRSIGFSSPSPNFNSIGTVGPNVLDYTDASLNNLPTVYVSYKVKTINSGSESNFSETITFYEPVGVPTDFNISWSSSHPYLTWSAPAPSNDISHYDIYKKRAEGSWQKKISIYSGTNWLDVQEFQFTRFNTPEEIYYKVLAVNDYSIESNFTPEKSVVVNAWISKGISENQSLDLPNKFYLASPFPNPFNPTTTLSFDLPEAAPVTLQIYDILGRKVWEYEQNSFNTGSYEIVWDGSNNYGQQVAAGVYIIRMTTPEFSSHQKVVYLK